MRAAAGIQPRGVAAAQLVDEYCSYSKVFVKDDEYLAAKLRPPGDEEELKVAGMKFPKGSKVTQVHEPGEMGASTGHRALTVGHGWNPGQFLEAAMAIPHPFTRSSNDMPLASALLACLAMGPKGLERHINLSLIHI